MKTLRAILFALFALGLSAQAEDRIYAGHYASGSAIYAISAGHAYRGHYATGSAAYTYQDGHIYAGHYASGSAVCTIQGGHIYRGHYASGTAAYSYTDSGEIPIGLLVFMAMCALGL